MWRGEKFQRGRKMTKRQKIEKGKINVVVDTQLFRGVHYER